MSHFEYTYHGYNFADGECIISIEYGSFVNYGEIRIKNLPCYPDEVSNQVSASWQEQSIIGRTGNLVAYTGTSDIQTSFNFDLHREHPILGLSDSSGKEIDSLITLIKSGCYPRYGSNMLYPPVTTFKFGDLWVRGRLLSVSDSWKKPIVNGSYTICTISVQMNSISRMIVSADDLIRQNKPRSHPTRGDTQDLAWSTTNFSTKYNSETYDKYYLNSAEMRERQRIITEGQRVYGINVYKAGMLTYLPE